jgi:hypothetical protein
MSKMSEQDPLQNHRLDRLEEAFTKMADAQAERDRQMSSLTGALEVQNQVLNNGFELMKKLAAAIIGVLSVVIGGTQVM